jgi:hypothetical protein
VGATLDSSLAVASQLLGLANTDEGKALLRRLLGMNKPSMEDVAAILRALPVPKPPRKG